MVINARAKFAIRWARGIVGLDSDKQKEALERVPPDVHEFVSKTVAALNSRAAPQ
jgi:hypothetical protein